MNRHLKKRLDFLVESFLNILSHFTIFLTFFLGTLMMLLPFFTIFKPFYVAKSADGKISMMVSFHEPLIDKHDYAIINLTIKNQNITDDIRNHLMFIGFHADFDLILHSDEYDTYCVTIVNIADIPETKENSIEFTNGNNQDSVKLKLPFWIISREWYFAISSTLFFLYIIGFLLCTAKHSRTKKLKGSFFSFYFFSFSYLCFLPFDHFTLWDVHFRDFDKSFPFFIYIAFLIGFYVYVALFSAKMTLDTKRYIFFFVVVSTWSIFKFSQLFSIYYQDIDRALTSSLFNEPASGDEGFVKYSLWNTIYSGFINETNHIKFSFRYYFELPPDKYYGWVAILQFIIGKVYEIVMLGSIGSLIIEHTKKEIV